MKTPFACVTFFDPDRVLPLPEGMDFEGLTRYLDQAVPTVNLPYAIKIRGTFSYVKTRSVPAQTRPYSRLVEVVKNQPTFDSRPSKWWSFLLRALPKRMRIATSSSSWVWEQGRED